MSTAGLRTSFYKWTLEWLWWPKTRT